MTEIDRISPTLRPPRKNDGTQKWRNLLFCHWEASLADLRTVVPAALEIDTFEDKAFIGLVPFEMKAIRPSWLPRWAGINFYETNVRTYVIHQGRPGVYFFSLDASSRLAVWAARLGWSLPYHSATMQGQETGRRFSYKSHRSNRGGELDVKFRVGKELGVSDPGTLPHFLFERYLLFVEHRQQIFEGQVHHAPYQVFEAEVESLTETLIVAAGVPDPHREPDLVHFSQGVDVEVFGIHRRHA